MRRDPRSTCAVIFGGAGFIGRHLAAELISSGYSVLVADTDPENAPEGAQFASVDVRRPIQLPVAPPEVVFNLAAVHRTPGHADHEYYDTNVAGALNVTAWAEKVGVRRLSLVSSISVYGPSDELKDEESAPEPRSAYGRSKLLAEQIHEDWAARDGDRQLSVARPAVVFGPGERGNFTRLAGALERRRFVYPGRKDTIKACGYVSDLARALLFAAEQDEPYFLYNYCYPRDYTIEEICETFREVAGYPLPRMLPKPVMSSVLKASSVAGGKHSGAMLVARMQKLTASTHIAARALGKAGFEWETDLELGLRRWLEATPDRVFA